jgi:hypothetical protein
MLGRLGDWWRGWRASTRRAHARTETTRTPPAGGILELHINDLDVAAADDGPFRGLADPLLLVAVYAIDDVGVVPALRGVVRFALPGAAPCRAMSR